MMLGWGGRWGIRATGSWTGTVRDQRSYEAAAMYWVCVQWSVVDGKQHRYIATHIWTSESRSWIGKRRENPFTGGITSPLLTYGAHHHQPGGFDASFFSSRWRTSSCLHSRSHPPSPSIFLKSKHCHLTNQHSLTQLSLATVAAQVARLAASSQLSGEASCVACAAAKQEHRRRPENQPPKLTIRLSDK